MSIPEHAVQNKMRQDGLDPDENFQMVIKKRFFSFCFLFLF